MASVLSGGTSHGIFPWNVPRVKVRDRTLNDPHYGGDKKERIVVCLECQKPECVNCFDTRHKYPRKKKYSCVCIKEQTAQKLRSIARFKELYMKNIPREEIVKILGISNTTYWRYLREIKCN